MKSEKQIESQPENKHTVFFKRNLKESLQYFLQLFLHLFYLIALLFFSSQLYHDLQKIIYSKTAKQNEIFEILIGKLPGAIGTIIVNPSRASVSDGPF